MADIKTITGRPRPYFDLTGYHRGSPAYRAELTRAVQGTPGEATYPTRSEAQQLGLDANYGTGREAIGVGGEGARYNYQGQVGYNNMTDEQLTNILPTAGTYAPNWSPEEIDRFHQMYDRGMHTIGRSALAGAGANQGGMKRMMMDPRDAAKNNYVDPATDPSGRGGYLGGWYNRGYDAGVVGTSTDYADPTVDVQGEPLHEMENSYRQTGSTLSHELMHRGNKNLHESPWVGTAMQQLLPQWSEEKAIQTIEHSVLGNKQLPHQERGGGMPKDDEFKANLAKVREDPSILGLRKSESGRWQVDPMVGLAAQYANVFPSKYLGLLPKMKNWRAVAAEFLAAEHEKMTRPGGPR